MSPATLLDIVIVNWNSSPQLAVCLRSLSKKSLFPSISISVVNNSPKSEGLEEIPDTPPFMLLQPEINIGFGGGCNLGAAQGKAPFILFLNPDIQFLADSLNSLNKLVVFLNSADLLPETGIIGIQLHNPDGSIQKNVARFPRFKALFPRMAGLDRICPRIFKPHYVKDIDYERTQVVDQVPGAFFLVKRELFERLGGFDERFFMYYEDVDLSYRAHLAGWNTLYLAEISVQHMGGGTTEQIKDRRLFYSLRSRVLYTGKHFGRAHAVALIFGILILEFPARLFRALLHFSLDELSAVIKALGLFLVNLLEVIRKL
jgi:GT2 family glycosyltransferase